MNELELAPWGQFLVDYFNTLIGSGSRLFPGFLLAFVIIAYLVYKYEGLKGGFWRYLFPKEAYGSKSVRTDLKLFLFNAVLRTAGWFNDIVSRAFFAILVLGLLGGDTTAPAITHPLLIALMLFIANDLYQYLYHRFNHTLEPLWVFHAVHHSAEHLIPLTVYRSHPIYSVISRAVQAVFLGSIDGVLLALFVTTLDFHTLLGINTLLFIYGATGNNLRHSHVWLSYGPYLSYIFMSPAMHQIHHSRAPEHYNKNFGNAFSVFDWMFGTLYIPKEKEDLEFGICDNNGRPLQPHDGLKDAIFVPFKHLGQWWVRRKTKDPNELQRAHHNM